MKKEMTEEQRKYFEIGFEEGYKIAKRIYKPVGVYIYTESELAPTIKKLS